MTNEPIIKIEHLIKKYGDFEAVKDISFEVKKGEIFAFLGPNGAGKSTTINILTTMLNKTSWKVTIDDFPLEKQDEVRKTFGIVFQDCALDDELTAWENMYFHAMLYHLPMKTLKKEIKSLMEFVELWEFKDRMIKQFSWGMKRRLEIAKGLLHHPKILFLDEPTVGLDPQSRNHIREHLQKINQEQGLTIFITTHYMDEVEKIADRVAIIDQGKIQAIGTVDELKKQTGKETMDEVFLAITGNALREELVSETDEKRARLQAKRRG